MSGSELAKSDLTAGEVEKIAGDFKFTEGPVWHPDGFLLFSDIPANRIYKWQPQTGLTVFREPTDNSNGLTLDHQGRLLACEHSGRQVSVATVMGGTDRGRITVTDRFEGKRLNSPNDVVVAGDGTIYFTDPPYGIKPEEREQPCNGVYHIGRDGQITREADDFERPNGLAFSPDGTLLYIDDSHHQHVRVFDVAQDGSLHNGRLFADLSHPGDGVPDGLKVDREGNVYVTNALGIWTYAANGAFRGVIYTPEVPANCAWGEDGFTLYMTCRTSVYRVKTQVAGRLPFAG